MISLSLGKVLNGWNGNPGDSRIYMVRDGNVVFYVGKLERSIVDHILDHCGLEDSSRTPDRLGQLILDSTPSSNGWLVDLLNLEDCAPIIREVTPMYKRLDTGKAEFALISYY
jgi:serine/threonine protein phosphatase PrpC